jgi:hypothetical protein
VDIELNKRICIYEEKEYFSNMLEEFATTGRSVYKEEEQPICLG